MRFKNTWLRQRHDLKDQSQSGYDLALADFGIDAGLSEQQIVDLIIHHRSLYSQKQRTRVDYFQRTIARAARRSDWRDGAAACRERRPAAAAPRSTPRCATGGGGRAGGRRDARYSHPGPRPSPRASCATGSRRRLASACCGWSSSPARSPPTTWNCRRERSSLPTSASSSRRTPCAWRSRRKMGEAHPARSSRSCGSRSRRPCSTPASSTRAARRWSGRARPGCTWRSTSPKPASSTPSKSRWCRTSGGPWSSMAGSRSAPATSRSTSARRCSRPSPSRRSRRC